MQSATPVLGGTVTFLLTDIEGSTKLWDEHPETMRLALGRHDALADAVVAQNRGTLIKSRGEGDSLFAVFPRAIDAVAAASALQQAYLAEHWPTPTPLRVRIALHTGESDLREGDYYGAAVNRCARLRSIAHGGQVLLSLATEEVVREALPGGASLRDLGLVRLQDLAHPEHVFQLAHPDLPGEFPPLRSLDALPNNLPVQLTSFVGREEAMTEVKRLLTTTHLLTLTGSGGCGKTRLALQVAADLLEAYADGVWLVELAPLADPALVPQALASTLGVREEPGRPLTETLVDYLKPRALLLMLDNCEHLLTACAQLAEALLRSCPSLRIVASSREGLGIGGEQTYRVPSLALPDPAHLPPLERLQEFEAVQLFADRARLSQATFAVTQANAPSVAQVCQRLDGIPLAIELAAARVKALSVEKLNERLDDMFRLLTGGSRTALPRQQTLRALIDWSYDLLSPSEQALLRRLSVFAGGWTLEAAEAVCAGDGVEEWEVLDLLTSLVEKSLVLYEEQGGEGRYRLLETVRQYARDRLLDAGEVAAVRDRHGEFFLQFAEEAHAASCEGKGIEGFDRLEREHDNLLAALEWSHEREASKTLRLAGAMGEFWFERGYWSEGRQWLERALTRAPSDVPTRERAFALAGAGRLASLQRDVSAAQSWLEESIALYRVLGDTRGLIPALTHLSELLRRGENFAAARVVQEEAVALGRGLGDARLLSIALSEMAIVIRMDSEIEAARLLVEESLAFARQVGDPGMIARCLQRLGSTLREQGDLSAARAHYEESVKLARATQDKGVLFNALPDLAHAAFRQGDVVAARALFEESLAIYRELGDKPRLAKDLEGLAEVAIAQRQPERASRLFGAVEAMREAMGVPLPTAERAGYDRSVAAIRTALGEEAFAAAWAEGRALSLEDAIKLALEE